MLVKTQGRYRVLIPRVGRQRQDRYIDVAADDEADAIARVERLLELDPRYGYRFWYDLRIVETFAQPELETEEERDARSERARARARAARARRR